VKIAIKAMALPKAAIFSTVSKKNASWSLKLDCTASLQAIGFTSEKNVRSSIIAVKKVTAVTNNILTAARIRLPPGCNDMQA
jgi:hypothetical protein